MTQDLVVTEEDLADFSLFDKSNPRSLINIVPKAAQDAIALVPRDLMIMDEAQLKKRVRPSDTLNFIRLNFWIEYNRAQEKRCMMRMENVVRGAASKEFLYGVVLNDCLKTAWMISPPPDYTVVQQDILHDGLKRLRQALKVKLYTVTRKVTGYDEKDRPIETVTTRPNVAAIKEIREITKWLADRVQGAIIQKVAIKTQSQGTLHVSGSSPKGPEIFEPNALELLQRTLDSVDKRLMLAEKGAEDPNYPDAEVIDVE